MRSISGLLSRRCVGSVVVALVVAGYSTACSRSESRGTPPNIVLIVIDTLRADHLDSYGYPHSTAPTLEAVARQGVLFERVIAPSSWTKTSMASITTSRDPDGHGVRRVSDVLPDELITLAEVLSAAGYHTIGINTNPWLLPRFGFRAGFDVYESPTGADAASVIALALKQVSQARHPFFLYLHFMDVHAPYTPDARFFDQPPLRLEGGAAVPDDQLERAYRKRGLDPPAVVQRVKQLYDAEIRATDAALETLLADLRRLDLLDDAILVVTSDHGESFGEHGTTEHGWNLYPEVYEVPLVFRAPGRLPRGRRLAAQVRSIDIAPTLLALAELAIPPSFEGRSLTPMNPDSLRDRVALSAVGLNDYVPQRDYVAVISPDHLYIRERRSGTEEFYDLRSDPGALRNLGADSQQAAALAAWVRSGDVPAPNQIELDADTRARLEALGYLDTAEGYEEE